MTLNDLNPDAGLTEFVLPAGKAIVWAQVPLMWSDPASPGAVHLVRALVNDTEVLRKTLTYEEAVGLDTVIGFQFTDALGCEYGFGAVFAKRKSEAK